MGVKLYHIWRTNSSDPFQRFACSIVEDGDTGDGYRIVDYDAQVADSGFLHQLATHMLQPINVRAAFMDGDVRTETVRTAMPREHGHFQAAIRAIPGAYLSAVGRV